MKRQGKKAAQKPQVQTGMSLVDSFIGLVILVIVTTGVVELFGMALSSQKAQAAAAARTAELARDKMEQILRFCGDTSNDAAPAGKLTGLGLAGCDNRIAAARVPVVGGDLNTRQPSTRYVDYLDADGSPVPAGADWKYIRVWEVSVPPSGTVTTRQIAVKAQARFALGNGPAAESTIVTSRSFPLH